MTEVHAGECIGGPFDGQKLAHTGPRCPVALFGEVTDGEYVWEAGAWRWRGGRVVEDDAP